jgi:hypothetical protein
VTAASRLFSQRAWPVVMMTVGLFAALTTLL